MSKEGKEEVIDLTKEDTDDDNIKKRDEIEDNIEKMLEGVRNQKGITKSKEGYNIVLRIESKSRVFSLEFMELTHYVLHEALGIIMSSMHHNNWVIKIVPSYKNNT